MKIPSLEDFFLVFAGNIFSSAQQKIAIVKLIKKKQNRFDWNYVLENAEKNQIIPQLHYLINSIENRIGIPDRFYKRLENLYLRSLFYNLTAKYTLKEVSTVFLRNEIKFLLVKGHAIAKFYPDYTHRSFEDIDILIPSRSMFQKASKLLLKKGYNVLYASHPKGEMWVHFIKEGRSSVDLHRELQWGKYRAFISLSHIFHNAVEVSTNNKTIFHASPEDNIVINCARLLETGSFIIRDLVDVRAIINQLKVRLDWEYLLRSAEENHLTPTLLSLLYLVNVVNEYDVIPERIFHKLKEKLFSKFLFSLLEKTKLKLPLLDYSNLSRVILLFGLLQKYRRDLHFGIIRRHRFGFAREILRYLLKNSS